MQKTPTDETRGMPPLPPLPIEEGGLCAPWCTHPERHVDWGRDFRCMSPDEVVMMQAQDERRRQEHEAKVRRLWGELAREMMRGAAIYGTTRAAATA